MRTSSRNTRHEAAADDYFERRSRALVVPEEEIEAWELDARELGTLGTEADYFNLAGSE